MQSRIYVIDWTNWLQTKAFADLTHWGRATHICVSKLIIIASDNGLSPGRRQAIIWNNAGILSIRLLGTNFSEILIEILTFSFTKMHLKVLSVKWWPFCLGLNVLTTHRLRLCWSENGSSRKIGAWQLSHFCILHNSCCYIILIRRKNVTPPKIKCR